MTNKKQISDPELRQLPAWNEITINQNYQPKLWPLTAKTLATIKCLFQASLGNITAALGEGAPDSLAVLGFFFQVFVRHF